MKREQEMLREYFESVQPSEDFQERLLKLEQKKTPRYWPRIAAAAAACLALGVIGWKVLDLKQGYPHNLVLPTEPTVQTDGPEGSPTESDPISPGASDETEDEKEPSEAPTEPVEDPTEQAAPPETEQPQAPAGPSATHPPATEPLQPEPTGPKETENFMGGEVTLSTEPPAPPATEPPATEPSAPPHAESTDTAPPAMEPPTEAPTEPPPATDTPSTETEPPAPERHITGWYEEAGEKEYVWLEDLDTGETLSYDVTGLLRSGYYKMTVEAFGLTLEIELIGDPQEDDLPDGIETEGWFDVFVTIL